MIGSPDDFIPIYMGELSPVHALISFACAWRRWLFCLCNLCNFCMTHIPYGCFSMTNRHIDLLLVWQAHWTIPGAAVVFFVFQATSWCTFNTFHLIPRMTIAASPRDSGHDVMENVGRFGEVNFSAPKKGGKGTNFDPKHQFFGVPGCWVFSGV